MIKMKKVFMIFSSSARDSQIFLNPTLEQIPSFRDEDIGSFAVEYEDQWRDVTGDILVKRVLSTENDTPEKILKECAELYGCRLDSFYCVEVFVPENSILVNQ